MPIGLAFGTMPYLLKARLTYADIGIFMLSTYPFSIKLLWSPVVDSMFVDELRIPGTSWTLSLGRRKSWIVPGQLIVGTLFLALSTRIDTLLAHSADNLYVITAVFSVLIFMSATQDIAVDGWALTLLSEENVGYASTAQTIGINVGYFLSFTVFLALNSVEACNKFLRLRPLDTPILTLPGYLQLCGISFIGVTLWLLFFRRERREANEDDMDIHNVYTIIWRICRLPHVQALILVHLIAKIGFQANNAVTGLKLVEHGLSKEDMAFAVLVDFPFQLVFGYLAAVWSRGDHALRPWLFAFAGRLVMATASMFLVAGLPAHIGTGYFLLIIVSTVLNSFAGTVQFVGISAFHTQIADPLIGGTYMTLLNTASNLGGTWPSYFVLKMVDYLSQSMCSAPADVNVDLVHDLFGDANATLPLSECVSEAGRSRCSAIGGTCHIARDGYYWTNTICVAIGAVTLMAVIWPICQHLQKIPHTAWRIRAPK